jgi:hypothetical protein
MKLRVRLIEPLPARSLGRSLLCGRRPHSSALPAAPLGVSPALRRPCNPTLLPALFLKGLPPGPAVLVESP